MNKTDDNCEISSRYYDIKNVHNIQKLGGKFKRFQL